MRSLSYKYVTARVCIYMEVNNEWNVNVQILDFDNDRTTLPVR